MVKKGNYSSLKAFIGETLRDYVLIWQTQLPLVRVLGIVSQQSQTASWLAFFQLTAKWMICVHTSLLQWTAPSLLHGLHFPDQTQGRAPVMRMLMWKGQKAPNFASLLIRKAWPLEMRKERGQQERRSCSPNHWHVFTVNYRQKYELQLIFLPGVTGLCVLCTLGVYLGSRLMSFVEWPVLCHLCSVPGTSLWLLILDTCPSQKFTGKGFLDKKHGTM